jgi:Zn-dependent protease with chaperone function
MNISSLYNSYPGLYIAQSFVHSLTTALLVDAAIRVWKIKDPATRQRLRLLIIIFPVLSFPLYQFINPDRISLSFRLGALFDSSRWMNLELLPGVQAGILFILLLSLTTLLFLSQELVPVVKHALSSRQSESQGEKPPDDSPVVRILAALPGPKPEVSLIHDKDLILFVTTGKKPVLYISTGSLKALTEDELQTAIAHELAHIERNKKPILVVAFLLRVLQFFNIVSLIEFRRIVQEEEIICDDAAVALTNNSKALAGTLRKFHPADDEQTDLPDPAQISPDRMEQYSHSLLIESRIVRLETYGVQIEKGGVIPFILTTTAVVVINYSIV